MPTICAISTAPGAGGIAVIRVSGPEAIPMAGCVVGDISALEHARATFRRTSLDEMMITVFRAPHSYTGEDTVEIACHGSRYIQQELIHRLTEAGCRLARGGEFTQRAFLNGKMDLTQAEAVADLIASECQAEQALAMRQLRGGVSGEMHTLRAKLLDLTSLLELELDFADHEDVEFADRTELVALLDQIEAHTHRLSQSFRAGNAIRSGLAVAIVGPTNAGKSTLLNALLGEERAIVSDIAGTTRDTIEESIVLDGIRYRLIDTAGLRDTSDTIEQLGIERSLRAIHQADIVVAVDTLETWNLELETRNLELETRNLEPGTWNPILLPVHNKSDLATQPGVINISAKRGEIQPLLDELIRIGHELTDHHGDVLISNARHYEALLTAEDGIRKVREGLALGLSGELIAMDLHDVLDALGSITGEITNDEILGNIFSKFCIGK